ncbi:hypothetical protein IEQ11_24290 [Lysobacter capsici]|uniref:hypothetical protein n=1 Tax=Lysobacter capsici TaxID=435897 RepID=UPI001783FD57|nr:hypothetical protein [Lysobacter capsici]UOF14791.1 hypothetical protein IEQ11_24290 [Lysobacter capsici]
MTDLLLAGYLLGSMAVFIVAFVHAIFFSKTRYPMGRREVGEAVIYVFFWPIALIVVPVVYGMLLFRKILNREGR